MSQLPLDQGMDRFQQNEERLDNFVNNPVGYTSSAGASVESLPAFIVRIESQLAAYGTLVGAASLSALNADLAHPAGTVALVATDGTSSNNGYYLKSGASGSGSWTKSPYDPGTVAQSIAKDQFKETHVVRYDSGGWYINPQTGVITARRTGGGGADTRLFLLRYNGTDYTIKGTNGLTRTLTIPYGNAYLWLDPAQVGFDVNNVGLDNIQVGGILPGNVIPIAHIVYGDAINSQTLLDDRGRSDASTALALANAWKNDINEEYHVINYDSGAWYLDPTTGVVTVVRTGSGGGDTRITQITYGGATYALKGTNGQTRTLTLLGGNTYLYLDPAEVGFDANNVTISNIQVGLSVPAGKVPIAHLVYNDAFNSRIFKDARPRAASLETQTLAKAWRDDLTESYRLAEYDAGGIYWDRVNSRLIIQRTRSDSDNRLAVLLKNPINSTVYTFKGAHQSSKSFTLTGGGNQTLYIDTATVADPDNVTLADIQVSPVTPNAIGAGKIPIAWLVYGNAINSLLIKDFYELPGQTNTGVTNIVRYSAKSVIYDPATFTFSIQGTDLAQDNRVLIFDFEGVTYTISGSVGAAHSASLDGSDGNQFVYVDRAGLTGGQITVNNFGISSAANMSANPTRMNLGRLVWNTALNSDLIFVKESAPSSAGIVPRSGEAALFMAGKIQEEKQVYKLAIYGDSIFASGFKDLTFPDEFGLSRYEQPPRNGNLASVQRDIYNYLNFNKPIFRNVMHADWATTGTGTTDTSWCMPNGNTGGIGDATQWERLLNMTDTSVGNTAEVTITGNATAVFMFEGGATGTDWETGGVNITVSVNGGAFVNPSTVLQGKLTKRGFGSSKVYDAALNSFQTSFTLPVNIGVNGYNKVAPMVELFYNGLNPASTYRFRITKPSSEARRVKLWGVYHFTGKTLIVHNESKPGFGWNMIYSTAYGDLAVSETDFVIIEAPMYHDGMQNASQIESNAVGLLEYIRSFGIQVALCSCPPGGVIPAGAQTAILGDPSGSNYHPGQNFNKYFDFMFKMNTSDLAVQSDSPKYGDTYTVVVNGTTYTFTCINSAAPFPLGYTYWQSPMDFPGFAGMPVTFTRVTGTGKVNIAYSSYQFSLKFHEHRDVMELVAHKYGYAFCDIFQAFVDQAETVGETIYTDGYNMDPGHPLYPVLQALDADPTNYPELSAPYKMNYLSNFVDLGDGHHLAYPAHPVIFEAVKNTLLRKTAFK